MRPLSDNDATARASLRSLLASHKGESGDVESTRAAFEAVMRRVPAADEIEYTAGAMGDVPGLWCRPRRAAERTILHLHGGWFVSGSPEAYRNFVGQIASRANVAAFIPAYRLAPEHPFPAAVEDARSAYLGLLRRGFGDVVIVGDSAGGSLALELTARVVRDGSATRPTALVLLSPVTDLSQSGVTWESRDAADLLFTRERTRELVEMYLGGSDVSAALSSRTQEFDGFPPIRIHVGDDEVLLDDSLRLAQRAGAAGVDVRLDVWEGMLHVFPSAFDQFEAANIALDEISAFIRNV
jgi:monoterpene epsilon-lactone hydrolase